MKTEPLHPAYRPDIDGLRAVAILCVLGFHAFPAWAPGGFVGVDIFFVISGYLISSILLANLQAEKFSLWDFYARRVRRIFPALILVLAASLACGYLVLWPDQFRAFGRHLAASAGFVANLAFERESGYFDGAAETKPLLHLWSLGVEEQFYIFWPLMLAAAWRWKHRAGTMIGVVFVASFAAAIWFVTDSKFVAQGGVVGFYSPFGRFWELLAGGYLAWLAQHGFSLRRRAARESAALAGSLLIVVALFAFTKNMPFPGWRALLPVGGAVLIIAAGPMAYVNRFVLARRGMVGIGLVSYPLYLWHWPLLSFARILNGEEPSRLQRILLILAAFALAALTYRLVEKPLRSGGLDKKRIFILLALMAALGIAGFGIMRGEGLPARFAQYGAAVESLDGPRLIDKWRQQVRLGTCHLEKPADYDHDASCIENKHPLLLLWGDSHAAALYPGLKALQETHGFGITQLTQGGCPPLFDLQNLVFRQNCNDINDRILGDLATMKPEVILLSAAWAHPDYPMPPQEIADDLGLALKKIRAAAPQAKIIVVGSEPRWLSPLPAIYRRAIVAAHALPPEYSSKHLDPQIAPLDDLLRSAAASALYLDPRDKMCNAGGCLTRIGDTLDAITYVDDEHITPAASVWLMNQFAPQILAALGLN
ncbi:MAG: acyltransferase family protein [Alphaproteobacteria bacterium]|nr:acyltransferase family protein [Alphaproteobacteria bacterium]